MSELTDRFFILMITATGFGGILVGWFGGFFLPSTSGWVQRVGMAVLALLFIGILVAAWIEFNHTDTEPE